MKPTLKYLPTVELWACGNNGAYYFGLLPSAAYYAWKRAQ